MRVTTAAAAAAAAYRRVFIQLAAFFKRPKKSKSALPQKKIQPLTKRLSWLAGEMREKFPFISNLNKIYTSKYDTSRTVLSLRRLYLCYLVHAIGVRVFFLGHEALGIY